MSNLQDEMDHFAEFGWSPERIAGRLGCTVSAVQKHLARARLRDMATQERATVTSRQSTERGVYGA